jgi:hypothetical protein
MISAVAGAPFILTQSRDLSRKKILLASFGTVGESERCGGQLLNFTGAARS